MSGPDWNALGVEFAATPRNREIVSDFVRFLGLRPGTCLDEAVLVEWLQEQVPKTTLERVIFKLYYLREFLVFLGELGAAPPGLFRRIWERPDLLIQLKGARRYDANTLQLEPYWQQILADFETSLRGFAPLQQARILRCASEFASLLERRGVRCPDEDAFLEWLDTALASCQVNTVALKAPRVARFCAFLMKTRHCTSNPVEEWGKRQVEMADALKRRKIGEAPQLRPPRFRSFLASRLEAFVAHKRALGRKYQGLYALELLDRHLREKDVNDLGGMDENFLFYLLASMSHWRASARKTHIGQLREFFHFLLRRGDVSRNQNPARFLPRVLRPPRAPYIFTVAEIVSILSCLREAKRPSAFDRQMLFTFFHLIYACGLRISEGIRLKVEDVDFERKTLLIRETKFGKSRLIPFGCRAAEYLDKYQKLRIERLGGPERTAPFFVQGIGRSYDRVTLDCYFREACRKAGVVPQAGPKPRVHDLRHAFAVHRLYKWYLEGANPQERLQLLSLYMGHQEVTYTEHYLHLAADLLRVAGRPLERPIESWLKKRQVFPDED